MVSELEIWYLGADVIKTIANPTVSEMIEMENHLEGLWHEIKSQKSSIEKYPAKPSPVRGFSEGGVSIDAPSDEKDVIAVTGYLSALAVKVWNTVNLNQIINSLAWQQKLSLLSLTN